MEFRAERPCPQLSRTGESNAKCQLYKDDFYFVSVYILDNIYENNKMYLI